MLARGSATIIRRGGPSIFREIGSPVTRKAFGEAIKQIRVVAREYGLIDLVHIELARDVGKSAEERRKIHRRT